MIDPSITKEQAVEKAKEVGERTYGDIGMFTVTVTEAPIDWRVRFSRPGALEDGETEHFSVWVNKETGEPRLFRGR
jgi:hypothetical protein